MSDLDDLTQSALHLENDHEDAKQGSPEQYDCLDRIRPDHRLQSAHYGIRDAKNPNGKNRQVDINIRHAGQSQGRQVKNDRDPTDVKEHEQGARNQPGGQVEPLLEKFISGSHVELAEERQVTIDDQGNDKRHRPHSYPGIHIAGVGLGGNGHEGNRREHGCEDRQTGHPPGNSFASPEIGVGRGSGLPLHEKISDGHHQEKVETDHQPVDQTEGGGRAGDRSRKNLGGADTGLFLARSNDDLSVWHEHDRNGYGNLHFRRERAGLCPSVRNDVISKDRPGETGVVMPLAVDFRAGFQLLLDVRRRHPSEYQQVRTPGWDCPVGSGRGTLRKISNPGPLVRIRIKAVTVTKKIEFFRLQAVLGMFDFRLRLIIPTPEKIKLSLMRTGHRVHPSPGSFGPGQFLPLEWRTSEIQPKCLADRSPGRFSGE